MEYSACVWCLLLGLLPASASFIDRITYSVNSEFLARLAQSVRAGSSDEVVEDGLVLRDGLGRSGLLIFLRSSLCPVL